MSAICAVRYVYQPLPVDGALCFWDVCHAGWCTGHRPAAWDGFIVSGIFAAICMPLCLNFGQKKAIHLGNEWLFSHLVGLTSSEDECTWKSKVKDNGSNLFGQTSSCSPPKATPIADFGSTHIEYQI
jgi:hypothetical protein